jgi:hypothetical protein
VYRVIRDGCKTKSHIGWWNLRLTDQQIERGLAYLLRHGYAGYDAANKLTAGPDLPPLEDESCPLKTSKQAEPPAYPRALPTKFSGTDP